MEPEPVAASKAITFRVQALENLIGIFGGSNLASAEAVFDAVQKIFFGNFRVSVMLDSNGCNTTAASAVAQITRLGSVAGKKAVVLAGTGPVGQRGAVLLAAEGAHVTLTSRRLDRAEAAGRLMNQRFGVSLTPFQVTEAESTRAALDGAQIVLAAGAAGIELLPQTLWQDHPTLEILADINTVPPMGIGGLEAVDKGAVTPSDAMGAARAGAAGLPARSR